MKIYLGELQGIMQGLSALADAGKDQGIPIKLSISILKSAKEIENEVKEVYEPKRMEILEKHAKRDEDGNIEKTEEGNVTIENQEEFYKDMNELNSVEVDLNVEPIDMELVEDLKIGFQSAVMLEKILK